MFDDKCIRTLLRCCNYIKNNSGNTLKNDHIHKISIDGLIFEIYTSEYYIFIGHDYSLEWDVEISFVKSNTSISLNDNYSITNNLHFINYTISKDVEIILSTEPLNIEKIHVEPTDILDTSTEAEFKRTLFPSKLDYSYPFFRKFYKDFGLITKVKFRTHDIKITSITKAVEKLCEQIDF